MRRLRWHEEIGVSRSSSVFIDRRLVISWTWLNSIKRSLMSWKGALMAIDWKRVKQANSKSELVEGLKVDRMALEWYARPENWGYDSGFIIWKGDMDPTYAAQVTLGIRKPDPNYKNNWQLRKEEQDGGSGKADTSNRGGNEVLEREHKGDAGGGVREG
jgi:hypothetical protein